MEGTNIVCPNCCGDSTHVFHRLSNVPVHSVLLMPTRVAAVSYPRADIDLGLCSTCGFIWNTAFRPEVHNYSETYEETQGFSPTFRVFHETLAESLIRKYDLRRKKIIEIGCGKGEFLALLCKLGENYGVGFDPAFVEERNPVPNGYSVRFVKDFYSEKYADETADFICCKMTLEHIPD